MAKCHRLPARYELAILGAFGMGIIYGLRVNISVALVSMVNHTAVKKNETASELCPSDTEESLEDGPFEWDSHIQGLILSSYFWGYIIFQLPGGLISEMFSAKYVFFSAVAINIVGTLLIPVMSYAHYIGLLAMRVLQGFAAGVSFPTMNVLIAHWSPPNERSTMASIIYSGCCLGVVAYSIVCGEIAKYLGWEYIYYIEAAVSSIWLIFWGIFVADRPEDSRFIRAEERDFLQTVIKGADPKSKSRKVPWKSMFTSSAFWAIFVANICANWGWFMLITQIPSYLKKVLGFPLQSNAWASSIPYFCQFIAILVVGGTLDHLHTKDKLSLLAVRKIATAISSVVPMICYIGLCFIGCNRILGVVLLTIAVASIGAMFSGYLINPVDIAPNYAGTIFGITNCVGTLSGICVPLFVGELTRWDPSIWSWRIVFLTSAGLYVIELVVYMIWAKADVQPWNELVETAK